MEKNNMYKQAVRVAVNNNFNCSAKEFEQLDKIVKKNPDSTFFINSNIKTSKLHLVKYHPYKVVVTANPDIFIDWNKIDKIYAIKDKISFVRVKWVPNNSDIVKLINQLKKHFKVVITIMRFDGWDYLDNYTNRKYYALSFCKLRLKEKYFKEVCKLSDSTKNVYICDKKHTGCGGCNLCATLNNCTDVNSLNLSSSGLCKFNCVCCFAKRMQNFLIKCGKNPIEYNVIKKNKKQLGTNKYNIAHSGK